MCMPIYICLKTLTVLVVNESFPVVIDGKTSMIYTQRKVITLAVH